MEEISMEEGEKKKGRPKTNKGKVAFKREQSKFMVNLSKEKESLELVFDLLGRANEKDYGREITFKDLALFALSKLTNKDIEKIQEGSLDEMEKVQKALNEYNSKNGKSLSLGEFLVKKLNIN